jgi:radical SAM-linked protein
MSLVSLSTADYSSLEGLVRRLSDEFTSHNVSISTGSLRVDSRFDRLFGIMSHVKKSGFTFAPEAGTDRLRQVINKNITEEDILTTARKVFGQGWDLMKLYFMFGLPTETDEDLRGLVEVVGKVQRIGKEVGGHRKQVNVSVGCFVPKPFTPFQWCAQDDRETIARKNEWLCKRLRLPRREKNERLSKLEAFMALGDRRVGATLLRAWEKGARFDGWSDRYQPTLWDEACVESAIDPKFYSDRVKIKDEVLPWDHLFAEMDKDFLWGEWELAQKAEQTPDCRWDRCLTCGLCGGDPGVSHQLKEKDLPSAPSPRKVPDYQEQKARARIRFSKTGRARYLSHLTVVRVFQRALHRVEAPLSYTGGFSKRPRTVFTPPVSMGVESLCEAADISLYEPMDLGTLQERLQKEMPPGFKVLKVEPLAMDALDAMNAFDEVEYLVTPEFDGASEALVETFLADKTAFESKESLVLNFETEKGKRTKDVRKFVLKVVVEGGERVQVRLTLDLKSPQSVKLERLLPSVFPSFEWAKKGFRASRADLRPKSGA